MPRSPPGGYRTLVAFPFGLILPRLFQRIGRTPPWLWLLLLIPMVVGLTRLRFDVEILNLLPDPLASVRGLKAYQRHFSDNRELIITLEAPTADSAESTARALGQWLRAQSNLVAHVTWQPGWMEDPSQAAELTAYLWLNQTPAQFSSLIHRLTGTNLIQTLRDTRDLLATSLAPSDLATRAYDPFGFAQLPASVTHDTPLFGTGDELFASSDGTFRLVFVEARPALAGYRDCLTWLAQVRASIAQGQSSGQIPSSTRLNFTGRPAFVTEIAGGMESDMSSSAAGTLAVIAVLFWLTHRRLRPLLWLSALLLAILAGTTALGGFCLGTINVVSLGFASILLGLAEDFGVVIYQESRSHPELSPVQLRRMVAPGIFWSALTTAGAFLILNLSVLPGLGQLGSLVALGIILAAVVMLFGFLPPLFRWRRPRDTQPNAARPAEPFLLFPARTLEPRALVWSVTALLLIISPWLLWKSGPRFDHSPNVLQPKNSPATMALREISARLNRQRDPVCVLIPGIDESQVARRLAQVNDTLAQSLSNHWIAGFTLPTALWPHSLNQPLNRPLARTLLDARPTLRAAALEAGFSTNALIFADNVLDTWRAALATTNTFWPDHPASHWLFSKIVSRNPEGMFALGYIQPSESDPAVQELAAHWPGDLEKQGILLCGWELLGTTIFDLVVGEFPRVLIPIGLLVLISLWFAFRRLREVLLSLVTLGMSGLILWAAMGLLGWDWNLLNLMALPLLLGMGVDFSIHIQLALRRDDGDLLAVRRSVGRALLLAGSTTVVGFGSLGFSTNTGMASLGQVCALGIALTLVTSVYLLPVWWSAWPQRLR